MQRYRWPILFFTAVAFWNVVGAGLFGFLINPPLPLYYMQGLNLTALHGHTALFGVYGFLGIGLMLFCLRGLKPGVDWNERVLKTASGHSTSGCRHGAAHIAADRRHPAAARRSITATGTRAPPNLMQKPIIQTLVWMRVPGDTIFSVGALSIAWFVLRLWIAPKRAAERLPDGAGTVDR